MNQCDKCGGTMIGDGYTSVMHCEFAEEETYEFHEPDANPVECDFKEDDERLTEIEERQDIIMSDITHKAMDRRKRIELLNENSKLSREKNTIKQSMNSFSNLGSKINSDKLHKIGVKMARENSAGNTED